MGVVLSQTLKGFTVSESCGNLVAKLVRKGRELDGISVGHELLSGVGMDGLVFLGLVDDLSFQVSNEFIELVANGFTMPVEGILDVGETVALEGLSDEDSGLARSVLSFLEGSNDFFDVVSVDNNSVPTEGFESALVDFNVVAERCLLRLTKSVDINDCNKVVQLV